MKILVRGWKNSSYFAASCCLWDLRIINWEANVWLTFFMDRAFYADLCGGGNRFLLKPATAGASARRAGTTATWDQMNKYFALMQMPIISSRYWSIVHGAKPEEVKKDSEGMQMMRILGKNMAFFLHCRKLAVKAGLPLPKQEQVTFTNFIRE